MREKEEGKKKKKGRREEEKKEGKGRKEESREKGQIYMQRQWWKYFIDSYKKR